MTLDLLFPNFAEIVRTPADVDALNQTILDLAVRGQLVAQDAGDEPASVLVARIERQQKQLTKEKAVDKVRKLKPVEAKELQLDVPLAWTLVRLGELVTKLGAGSTPLGGKSVYVEEGIKFIRSQNVWNDGLRLSDVAHISETTHSRMSNSSVMPKDVLLNITGASIGRSAIVPDDFDTGNVSQHVSIIRLFEPKLRHFIHLFLVSSYAQRLIDDVQVGISRAGLSMNRLQDFVVPLPPLAEQHRIVAKVDELFAHTRALAARLEQAQAQRRIVTAAALHRVDTAADAPALSAAWATVRAAFGDLCAEPQSVAALRQTILNLAVRGRLVAQDAGDEPASVLLERIREEQLASRGLELPKELKPSQFPHEVPKTWVIAAFASVALIASNLSDPAEYPHFPHIAPDNIEKGTGRLLDYRTVLEDGIVSAKHYFSSGHILYSKIRPNLSKVVMVDFDGLCSADMYPIEPYIERSYLHIYMLSSTFTGFATKNDTRVAMPKINKSTLYSIPVPLPPLAEQRRIVAKVDELMRLCDALERKLAGGEAARSQLAGAVLAGVVA